MTERLPWASAQPLTDAERLQRTREQVFRDAERSKWEKRIAWYRRYPATPASKARAAAIGQDK